MKSVRIPSFSGPQFFSPHSFRMRDNTDQRISKYGHFYYAEHMWMTNAAIKQIKKKVVDFCVYKIIIWSYHRLFTYNYSQYNFSFFFK